MRMRPIFFLFALLVAFALPAGDLEPYVGLSGALTLPQGGSRMHHVGGAAFTFGAYHSDNCAFEGQIAWLEDACQLGVQEVLHFSGLEFYNRLFGFSQFDPFVTVGCRGWMGNHGVGQVGPKAGIGAFYHLTDRWSLRADADATLGLDSRVEMLYGLGIGLQYTF